MCVVNISAQLVEMAERWTFTSWLWLNPPEEEQQRERELWEDGSEISRSAESALIIG